MLKNLNAQSKTITGAAIILGGAALLSRIIGLVRDRILAHNFGADAIMDAYYAAFKIPDLIYSLLVVGALTAGFIPVFTRLRQEKKDDHAWRVANNIFNITGVTLAILAVMGIILAQKITPLIAPGFTPANQALVTGFTRIIFLSPLFLGLSMTLGGVLQSLRRFFIYSLAPIFYNFGIIIGAVALVPWLGPKGLAVGVVLGAAMHLGIQVYGAREAGWRWQWYFNLKDTKTRLIGKLMIPRTLGLAITHLNLVVITILASWLPVGSVSVYNYAFNLQSVPIGIIGIPFALAVFPLLSELYAAKDYKKMGQNLSATIRKILFLITPITIVLLLLRAQIVRIILGTGKFDWAATIQTADALAFFAFGLFAQALIPLLARGFYAMNNTKTPFIISLISELVTIILALVLMDSLKVAGLVLAVSTGAILNAAMLFIALRQKIKEIEIDKIVASLYRISLAGLIMAILIQWVKTPLGNTFNLDYFMGIFGQGVIAGMVGISAYGLACYFLKLPEFINFKNSFEKRWLTPKNIDTPELIETKE